MTAPANLSIAQMYFDELFENIESFKQLPAAEVADYLYVASAVVGGGWVDTTHFEPITRGTLRMLACYPLLTPYLEMKEHTADQMTVIKTAHMLKE